MSPLRTAARVASDAETGSTGPARRPGGSDVGSRILFALPLIALALFLVIEGGAIFAVGIFVIGCICMHELYGMYEQTNPVRLAGLLALAGPIAATALGKPPPPPPV